MSHSRHSPLGRAIQEFWLPLTGLVFIWKLLSFQVNFIPAPEDVFVSFVGEIGRGFLKHFWVSLYRIIGGIGGALVLGAPLGMLSGRDPRFDRFISPLVYFTYPLPKIVFLPVVLLIFGIGDLSKIFLIGMIVFFQILVATRDSARSINPSTIKSIVSLGATGRQIYRHVVIPHVLPSIFTALRISTGTAVAVLFFVESFATQEGLGYYIMDSWGRIDYTEMFVGIVGMSILGYGLYRLIDYGESKLCRWTRF